MENPHSNTWKVLFVKPILAFVILTVSPISKLKAVISKDAEKDICCLTFNNCIFDNLWHILLELVKG